MKKKVERFLINMRVESLNAKKHLKSLMFIVVGTMLILAGIGILSDKANSNSNLTTFDSIKIETEAGIEKIKKMNTGDTLLVNFYWNECEDCKKIEKSYVKALVNQKKNKYTVFNVKEITSEQKDFFVQEMPDVLYRVENKYLFETPTVAKVTRKKDGSYAVIKKNKNSEMSELNSILK